MKFTLADKLNKQKIADLDAVFLPVFWKNDKPAGYGFFWEKLDKASQKLVENFIKSSNLKSGDARMLPMPAGARVFVVIFAVSETPLEVALALSAPRRGLRGGLPLTGENKSLVLAVRRFVRGAKSEGSVRIGLCVEDLAGGEMSPEFLAELIVKESLLAHYDFAETFKTAPKGGWKRVREVVLFSISSPKLMREAIRRGIIEGEAVNQARALSNYPPGEMAPEGLAEAARDLAAKYPELAVTVFDEHRLEAMGMNAILAVGKGSANPPRLIVIEYRGASATDQALALVGKGITFDSGGLNLKPGESMADMHLDMSGGAAVLAAMGAVAALKLPVNVTGYIAAAENMPSGFSYRQGDIIKAFGGKTIEIGNTDAEGRVVLADAIEYAKTKHPALIVTLATLTGAAVVALGTRFSALFVKGNKALEDAMRTAGEASGDALWPLPLTDENERDVEGNFADVINTSRHHSRYGGASTGAAFLSRFAKPVPFAHIDMAPRMIANSDEEFLAKGSVGFGVGFFVELAKEWAEIQNLINSK